MRADFGILRSVHTKTETHVDQGRGASAARPGPCLVLVYGPEGSALGSRLSLEPGASVVLGRAEPSFGAGPLGDSRISQRHLRVTGTPTGLAVEDLGSKNGTLVQGKRIERACLNPGDFIQIGSSFLYYAVEAPFLEAGADTLLGGISAATAALRDQAQVAAPHGLPVLITGPSGAGKERVARELHRLSGLKGEFVALNCATLSEQLAESELFGHVRGAFTGADTNMQGLFQRADGGTLFLDEVATLPDALQPKLLRAIQEGKVRPVGDSVERSCRPRILCATNEPLQAMVSDGRFREDLYARLHGSTIEVPGLDEHREDLGWLSLTLLASAGHSQVRPSAELMWRLLGARWPLNVRGLAQCLLTQASQAQAGSLGITAGIETFLNSQDALAQQKQAQLADALPSAAAAAAGAARKRVTRPEQSELEQVLRDQAGRVERVAQHFDVRRQQIYRWLDAYGLDIASFRPAD